jgi:hypothetical protein
MFVGLGHRAKSFLCVGNNGLWGYARADLARDAFEAFTQSLAHRGPDDFGIEHWPDTNLWLGHRRLAIIDLPRHRFKPHCLARFTVVCCQLFCGNSTAHHSSARAKNFAKGQGGHFQTLISNPVSSRMRTISVRGSVQTPSQCAGRPATSSRCKSDTMKE